MANKLAFYRDKNIEGYSEFEKFSSSNVYYKHSDDQFDRIEVWSTDVIGTLSALVTEIAEPIFLLYILHVGRNRESARYQSTEMHREEIFKWIDRFGDYLANDSRHDIWFHSPKDNETIVYDRDNIIYIYGAKEKFEQLLLSLKFSAHSESISLPVPHGHRYHTAFDDLETELIESFAWRKTPLQDED